MMKARTMIQLISAVVLVAQPILIIFCGQANAQHFRGDNKADVSMELKTFQTANLFKDLSNMDISRSMTDTVSEAWQARYNGLFNQPDIANAIAVDAAGNVYVTGASQIDGASYDYITIKYNTLGVEQWAERYNGQGNSEDEANAIAVDEAGNVYVTGYSIGSDTYRDYATIKYNTAGVEQWTALYNSPDSGQDIANAIAVDEAGNVYVTGRSDSSGSWSDYVTIKYDSLGVERLALRYNGPGNGEDEANAIALDAAGNIYVTGYTRSVSSVFDYTTIKYNPEGVVRWVRHYDGPGSGVDRAYDLVTDIAGNVYVTGKSYGGSDSSADYATIKYDSIGAGMWTARYNGPGDGLDEAWAIAVDTDGNTYVTGNSEGSEGNCDYTTIKYNSSGIRQWVARYDGPVHNNDFARALALDLAGNVYVTGFSYYGDNSSNYATLKYDSSGLEQWAALYADMDDEANDIAVDADGNVYVTGHSLGSVYGRDCITIKYTQVPVSIRRMKEKTPAVFSLKQNFPNPFNSATSIEFYLPGMSDVEVSFYNSAGQAVDNILMNNMNPGKHIIKWDTNQMASGVYFYKLKAKASGYMETKKCLLIK
ncbi:MAG: SBBP repeat-containing protein [Calditrichaceae bacterium]|nr:SBBP repeat-containing protein [Calditrichaceae bacterium]MBN2708200.1 SBBP repeat-containing protein [Calditrichaceae bacterium]RQV97392.1 MAG: T9SS C-terminal target domain-containing protein [Calditrichota bacterium]